MWVMPSPVDDVSVRSLPLVVPADPARSLIEPGSAIVARPFDEGRVLCDYEGNRYGAVNLQRFAERAWVAFSRAVDNYPTTARCSLDADDVVEIGVFDADERVVHLYDDKVSVAADWIGVDEVADLQLSASGRSPAVSSGPRAGGAVQPVPVRRLPSAIAADLEAGIAGFADIDTMDVVSELIADVLDSVTLAARHAGVADTVVSDIVATVNDYVANHYFND